MRKGLRKILCVAAATLIGWAAFAAPTKITLSGFIKDAATGEALPGALVYPADLSCGATSNSYGFYSISLSESQNVIKCSYAGYVTDSLILNSFESKTYDFLLIEDAVVLEAAKIFSKSKREEIAAPQMGKTFVDAGLAKKLPALGGETDIIRVIQMMPGVQTPSEGSTGFSVRGGGIDQNLVMIDGAPVYNTGHVLGFLSMFNSDAVKNAQLYKGDFPAQYGGRNSSVLDITTKDGNTNHFSGNASIGLIDSRVCLEGPIVKNRLSFMVSARRTYMDLFFPLFKKIPQGTKMNFYDANAKLSWIISDKDRIYVSAFSGRDIFSMGMEEFQLDKMSFSFMNNTQSIRWNHVFSPKLFLNVTAYNSRYDSKIGCEMDIASFDYAQRIREAGIKAVASWYINPRNTFEFGADFAGYVINPGETIPVGTNTLVRNVKMDRTNALKPSLFVQNEQKLGPVTLRYGLRASTFSTIGKTKQRYFDPITHNLCDLQVKFAGEHIKTYWGIEPRASLSWAIGSTWAVKAAYSRSYQYIQQAIVSITGSPVDTWFTASPNVKPQISDQVSTGFNKLFLSDALELSLEVFYKHGSNTMDFIDNSGLVVDNPNREGLLRFGKSNAYGAELMLKADFDKWGGWISYTYSDCFYDIPEINGGKKYRSPLNHRHSVNFVLTYDFTSHWSASADWVYYSGAPTTYPVGRFRFGDTYAPIYSSRNEDSMPDYHRLDLSVTYRTKRLVEGKRWGGELNLSFYNAYNRHNAWSLAFGYNRETELAEARKVYLFTIIPSVSYNIKF